MLGAVLCALWPIDMSALETCGYSPAPRPHEGETLVWTQPSRGPMAMTTATAEQTSPSIRPVRTGRTLFSLALTEDQRDVQG